MAAILCSYPAGSAIATGRVTQVFDLSGGRTLGIILCRGVVMSMCLASVLCGPKPLRRFVSTSTPCL
eukprot:4263329-Pyramimonas_sp.AAC.1